MEMEALLIRRSLKGAGSKLTTVFPATGAFQVQKEGATMKKFACVMMVSGICVASLWPAHARDTKVLLPIAAAMQTRDSQEKLGGSVKFFFGTQRHTKILTRLGTDVSNRQDKFVQ